MSDRQETGQNWSKTGLDLGGLYRSEVMVGPEGAEVRTESSFLGVRESTSYPRWMITSAAFFFVALLLFFGFVVISAALAADMVEYVALGIGIVGFAFLLGYVFYRFYYTPPRSTNEEQDE